MLIRDNPTLFLTLEIIISVILKVAMPQITPDSLDRALGLLGELIAVRGHPLQHFVVCGGSSLLALRLVKRTTTQDVDILARMGPDGMVTPRPLPNWLVDAASDVGKQLDLPNEWFNDRVAEETRSEEHTSELQ